MVSEGILPLRSAANYSKLIIMEKTGGIRNEHVLQPDLVAGQYRQHIKGIARPF
jgi:hypothetical protein